MNQTKVNNQLRSNGLKPQFKARPNKLVVIKNRILDYKLIIIICLVVIGLLGGFLYHWHEDKLASNNQGPSSQNQINKTVEEVGKLMLLPSGEEPTLAIVNNAAKYKDVSFFKNAENGDRLLVYAQAREAILYRPSINKIIAVAPLSTNSQ